jgi:hypothetical protein
MGALERMAQHFGMKKSNIIEDGGLDFLEEPETLAAHFEGEDYTEEEMREILNYAKFIKSKRKED